MANSSATSDSASATGLFFRSRPPPASPPTGAPYAIYNIGNHSAIGLESFIAELERLLGRTAVKQYLPLQPGDVRATYASVDRLAAATGFAPTTSIHEGLARFVSWYREYYGETGAPA